MRKRINIKKVTHLRCGYKIHKLRWSWWRLFLGCPFPIRGSFYNLDGELLINSWRPNGMYCRELHDSWDLVENTNA
jgi:hypothetical protein